MSQVLQQHKRFQSTPPARGATIVTRPTKAGNLISIHAPREGGDSSAGVEQAGIFDFNPRPPRGGRLSCKVVNCAEKLFQSTPPARGATFHDDLIRYTDYISIHAPREGGDVRIF